MIGALFLSCNAACDALAYSRNSILFGKVGERRKEFVNQY